MLTQCTFVRSMLDLIKDKIHNFSYIYSVFPYIVFVCVTVSVYDHIYIYMCVPLIASV